MRGATGNGGERNKDAEFQSTRPVRGATHDDGRLIILDRVSIHAPRAGRDLLAGELCHADLVSIHAPRAGRDYDVVIIRSHITRFNPRAPCGARPPAPCLHRIPNGFNPRAPCGARHSDERPASSSTRFNPRAPCGARLRLIDKSTCSVEFQSTRPVRGATRLAILHLFVGLVSIHAPRAGRDCSAASHQRRQRCFNPRAPCGARPQARRLPPDSSCFNPRAPCGARLRAIRRILGGNCFNPRAPCGARRFPFTKKRSIKRVSIHAPRAGRDFYHFCCYMSTTSFNPRAPCGARPMRTAPTLQSRCFNPRAPCGARPRQREDTGRI